MISPRATDGQILHYKFQTFLYVIPDWMNFANHKANIHTLKSFGTVQKITEPVQKVVVLINRAMLVCCELSQAGLNDMFSRFFFINLVH